MYLWALDKYVEWNLVCYTQKSMLLRESSSRRSSVCLHLYGHLGLKVARRAVQSGWYWGKQQYLCNWWPFSHPRANHLIRTDKRFFQQAVRGRDQAVMEIVKHINMSGHLLTLFDEQVFVVQRKHLNARLFSGRGIDPEIGVILIHLLVSNFLDPATKNSPILLKRLLIFLVPEINIKRGPSIVSCIKYIVILNSWAKFFQILILPLKNFYSMEMWNWENWTLFDSNSSKEKGGTSPINVTLLIQRSCQLATPSTVSSTHHRTTEEKVWKKPKHNHLSIYILL